MDLVTLLIVILFIAFVVVLYRSIKSENNTRALSRNQQIINSVFNTIAKESSMGKTKLNEHHEDTRDFLDRNKKDPD